MCITIKGTTVSPKFVVPFAAPGVGRTGGGFYCAFFSSAISKPCRTTAAWIMSTFSFPCQLLHFIRFICHIYRILCTIIANIFTII